MYKYTMVWPMADKSIHRFSFFPSSQSPLCANLRSVRTETFVRLLVFIVTHIPGKNMSASTYGIHAYITDHMFTNNHTYTPRHTIIDHRDNRDFIKLNLVPDMSVCQLALT